LNYHPIMLFLGFSGASDGQEPACNTGDRGSTPGLGRSSGNEKVAQEVNM